MYGGKKGKGSQEIRQKNRNKIRNGQKVGRKDRQTKGTMPDISSLISLYCKRQQFDF